MSASTGTGSSGSTVPDQAESEPPLSGLLIIEAGEGVGLGYCGQILAALGADVIKVEPPRGDAARRAGPFPPGSSDPEQSGLFLYLNRNKRSVVLDLDGPLGRDAFARLVGRANVLIEGFGAGYLDEVGVSFASLLRQRRDLVITSITPFGQDGPYRDYLGTELTLYAAGGLMNLTGDANRKPLKLGGTPLTYLVGVYAFSATLAAVLLAEVSGQGQHIDISAMEAAAASHFEDLVAYDYRGLIQKRPEMKTLIPCADGFVSFAIQGHHWPEFRKLIFGDEPVTDSSSLEEAILAWRAGHFDNDILRWAATRTKEQVYHEAQAHHLPAAYLADMKDVVDSPQLRSRQYFVDIDHPKAGNLAYPGFPARLAGVDLHFVGAPLLGQHTASVLRELAGLTSEELERIELWRTSDGLPD